MSVIIQLSNFFMTREIENTIRIWVFEPISGFGHV